MNVKQIPGSSYPGLEMSADYIDIIAHRLILTKDL